MAYRERTPEELLALGLTAPEVTEQAWTVHWGKAEADPEELFHRTVPATVDFHTSGSTGPRVCWRRTRENVWLEAGMLAGFVAPERPEALLSCVPPVHLYGALASVLIPAHLRVPAWFRPSFYGAMPELEQRRLVVVATPWIFTLLLENMAWVRRQEHLTVLHGGAMLPSTAGDFLDQAGPERALIVEVLGSTEAGGIATRRWRTGSPPPWTLFPDVSYADSGPVAVDEDGESQLVVRGPRLAFAPGQPAPLEWTSDDYVRRLDDRTFAFAGRRNRLVKVNGRRISLDEAELVLRASVDCADLALLPVTHHMIGEHVDLLVVLRPGTRAAEIGLVDGIARIGLRPRKVHFVPRIERSDTGKLRRVQPALTSGPGTPHRPDAEEVS
ncbi:class I adenylate-forming enzyme family protein [Micromonospora sp. NPDC047793]|uniref:AMP-binding protein n=1 Tax=unclassified Micromonospora TaxID=2617518 RepID=UPI001034FCA8|nr:class I adenylate-forming enzyme family protein [Verrucosispora sp. SN26_14.1]TBL45470.1 long-chain fatty acid--CoA ligase [Verrucosispora sp. SN26_14.1]